MKKKNRGRKMVNSEWPESDAEKGDAVIEVQSCHLCLIASYAFPHSFVSLSICLSARPSVRPFVRSLSVFHCIRLPPGRFPVSAGTIPNGRRTFRSLHSLQSLLSFALLEYICPLPCLLYRLSFSAFPLPSTQQLQTLSCRFSYFSHSTRGIGWF